uniref:Protein strawberry notch homolog 1 n=1 Tax=Gasterosteus aculeatus aculeatus TaxID=481459 RepID=A0AAQ4RRX5_GASAC
MRLERLIKKDGVSSAERTGQQTAEPERREWLLDCQMDPGQDLLLAALSESGICPNDFGLFDVDSQDTAQPSTAQQSISISALDVGGGAESVEVVRSEPPAPVPIVTIRHKPQPSTTTFVLNQLNQLPSLGSNATKQCVANPIKHTITVTKVVHVTNSALRGCSSPSITTTPSSASTLVPSNREQQIQLKDLLRSGNVKSAGLKGNSLMELMRLKPPPNIAPPVATATATGEVNNGIKKEVFGKDAARIWINDDIKMQPFPHSLKIPGMKEEDEPEEEEEDELGHAETYAEYMPMKLKIGQRHPDPVVETSSLSSVNPPDVWYRLSISEEVIDRGCLSALQLEAITYAAQQHETFLPSGDRAAYLIGDGAGVGKGRTIAGVIYENYLLGRKRSLWFSVSNDLKYDAERDLRDIGAKNIQVHSLNKKGVIFATYSSLIGESQSGGKYKTRFQQLLHWCGEDFDGVIVYDECHKAKNVCPIGSSKPTKTGLAVLELQNKLPKARVVYASATGASEPRNMAYMNRLGIWGHKTPFREFGNFIQAVERRGVGAMEIVAMDMKLRGMYIARQLSFTGVTFKIEEVPLTQQYINMYNKSVRLVSTWVSARERFQQKSMWGQFWSAHQRFFKYLCIASKVRRVVQLAREEVQNGKCVVIGLQSTGEARTLEALEEGGGELNDFVSTAKGVLQSLIEKHFPIRGSSERNRRKGKRRRRKRGRGARQQHGGGVGSSSSSMLRVNGRLGCTCSSVKAESQLSCLTSQDAVEHAQMMKKELLEKLEDLAEDLPPNTLDELIDELGGPENVAEMTGRKGRVVSNDDGSITYESRSELDVPVEILNLTEKQRFMDGEKNIAIISEAASSGISLQADRRVKNQRRRVHMTLELPWSADRAIQQFGRTHRSNQVTAPEYVFLISELAGEQRFASIVAKRLESLGALTHGDRRATETRDLSRFNFDNKVSTRRFGPGSSLVSICRRLTLLLAAVRKKRSGDRDEIQSGLIGVGLINMEDRSGTMSLDKDYNNMGKFLNRILGMEVQQQNALFQYFSDTLAAVILEAKKSGRYDMGILGKPGEMAAPPDCCVSQVSVERGMSWEEATHAWADQSGPDDGFYEVNAKKRLFLVYRPNTGRQVKLEVYADIKKKFKKVLSDDAKQHWMDQYTSSAQICSHAYWRGNCKKASVGLQCEVGLRCRTYYVLCGSVLSVWNELEEVLTPVSGTNVKVQIVRLRTEDGQRIVGESTVKLRASERDEGVNSRLSQAPAAPPAEPLSRSQHIACGGGRHAQSPPRVHLHARPPPRRLLNVALSRRSSDALYREKISGFSSFSFVFFKSPETLIFHLDGR